MNVDSVIVARQIRNRKEWRRKASRGLSDIEITDRAFGAPVEGS